MARYGSGEDDGMINVDALLAAFGVEAQPAPRRDTGDTRKRRTRANSGILKKTPPPSAIPRNSKYNPSPSQTPGAPEKRLSSLSSRHQNGNPPNNLVGRNEIDSGQMIGMPSERQNGGIGMSDQQQVGNNFYGGFAVEAVRAKGHHGAAKGHTQDKAAVDTTSSKTEANYIQVAPPTDNAGASDDADTGAHTDASTSGDVDAGGVDETGNYICNGKIALEKENARCDFPGGTYSTGGNQCFDHLSLEAARS